MAAIKCPSCKTQLSVDIAKFGGKRVRCPKCGNTCLIPSQSTAPPSPQVRPQPAVQSHAAPKKKSGAGCLFGCFMGFMFGMMLTGALAVAAFLYFDLTPRNQIVAQKKDGNNRGEKKQAKIEKKTEDEKKKNDGKKTQVGKKKTTPPDKKKASTVIYATPQEAFQAIHAAEKKRDFATVFDLHTKKSQTALLAGGLLAMHSLGNKIKQLRDVQLQHGITNAALNSAVNKAKEMAKSQFITPDSAPAIAAMLCQLIKDRRKVFAEGYDAVTTPPPGSKPLPPIKKRLGDVRIDGDTATGEMFVDYGRGESPNLILFRKEQGSWRIAWSDNQMMGSLRALDPTGALTKMPKDGPPRFERYAGTTWTGEEYRNGATKLTFILEKDGKAIKIDAKGKTYGTWVEKGKSFVFLSFDNGDLAYQGNIIGASWDGKAYDVKLKGWKFSLKKVTPGKNGKKSTEPKNGGAISKIRFKEVFFQPPTKRKNLYYSIRAVAFTRDSEQLIWVRELGRSYDLLRVNLANGKPVAKESGAFRAAEYTFLSPDARLALNHISSASTAQLWDLTLRNKVAVLKGFYNVSVSEAEFPLHARIVATHQYDSKIRSIKIWDVSTGNELSSLTYSGLLMKLAISANGKRLAAVVHHDKSDYVVTWELASGKQKKYKQTGHTPTLVVSPDGSALIVRRYTPQVRGYSTVFLDVKTGEVQKTLKSAEPNYKLHQTLAVSPDGRLVAAGAFGRIAVWYVPSGKLVGLLELKGGESGQMFRLQFSPNSRKLVSIHNGSNLRVWELQFTSDD